MLRYSNKTSESARAARKVWCDALVWIVSRLKYAWCHSEPVKWFLLLMVWLDDKCVQIVHGSNGWMWFLPSPVECILASCYMLCGRFQWTDGKNVRKSESLVILYTQVP